MGAEKTSQLNVRVSQSELDRWKEVAGPRNLGQWVRDLLNQASEPLPERENREDHR